MGFLKYLLAIAISGIFTQQICSQIIEFDNPIAEQRADPYVCKTDDETYYFTATVPDYDRIIIRKAKSINGLKNANEKTIWHKHETGVMGHHIWAPELHRIDGTWYLLPL